MHTLLNIIAVFLGSGLGGVCRWGLSQWINGQYPFGTFAVNILGSFILGLLTKIAPGNEQVRLLLMTGFCGGFTTFSTFMSENFMMLRGSQLLLSLCYIAISLSAGILAAWGGYNIPR